MPRKHLGLLAVILAAAASPAFAQDADPTEQEVARIAEVLRAEGFTEWDEIEREGAFWEVEDAVDADGREYELKLDRSLAIVEREED